MNCLNRPVVTQAIDIAMQNAPNREEYNGLVSAVAAKNIMTPKIRLTAPNNHLENELSPF